MARLTRSNRNSVAILLMVILCCWSSKMSAQFADQIYRAAALDDQGRFQEVIGVLSPLLTPLHGSATDGEVGVGWNLLGIAFENTGKYDAARQSYEESVRILKQLPNQEHQYASALDNFGSLKSDTAQFEESKRLRLRAQKIYYELEDSSGIARTSENLAIIAIGEEKHREAEKLLQAAFGQMSLISNPNPNDIAELYSARALLYLREKRFAEAIEAAGRAITLWSTVREAKFYLLVPCLVIRARAYVGQNKRNAAADDLMEALNIIDNSVMSPS